MEKTRKIYQTDEERKEAHRLAARNYYEKNKEMCLKNKTERYQKLVKFYNEYKDIVENKIEKSDEDNSLLMNIFKTINEKEFDTLVGPYCLMKSFYHEQPERFEIYGSEEKDVPPNEESTMHWYKEGSAALTCLYLYRQKGYKAVLLWDMAQLEYCIVVNYNINKEKLKYI